MDNLRKSLHHLWSKPTRQDRRDTVQIKINYGFTSGVLAASLKTRNHVLSCLPVGADIISVPESLFFEMFHHPLTDHALAEFDRDWERVLT